MEIVPPANPAVCATTCVAAPTGAAASPQAAGYRHSLYAASLREFGHPLELPRAGAWVLRRPVPFAPCRDAMGCYPLMACRDWNALAQDLEELPCRIVSLAAVVDPFFAGDEAALRRAFPAVVRRFKDHYVVDLRRWDAGKLAPGHRRNVRKALARVEVRPCGRPLERLDDWTRLYDALVRRHSICGIRAFSRQAFARQLDVPGLAAFEALDAGEVVGMLLWYVTDDVAYYHLGASSEAGYRLGASFALFWQAIGHFAAAGLRWLDLGAGAGTEPEEGGLTRFKRGWATGARPTYFCGRVFDRARYDDLARAAGCREDEPYFPAYRKGEFG